MNKESIIKGVVLNNELFDGYGNWGGTEYLKVLGFDTNNCTEEEIEEAVEKFSKYFDTKFSLVEGNKMVYDFDGVHAFVIKRNGPEYTLVKCKLDDPSELQEAIDQTKNLCEFEAVKDKIVQLMANLLGVSVEELQEKGLKSLEREAGISENDPGMIKSLKMMAYVAKLRSEGKDISDKLKEALGKNSKEFFKEI